MSKLKISVIVPPCLPSLIPTSAGPFVSSQATDKQRQFLVVVDASISVGDLYGIILEEYQKLYLLDALRRNFWFEKLQDENEFDLPRELMLCDVLDDATKSHTIRAIRGSLDGLTSLPPSTALRPADFRANQDSEISYKRRKLSHRNIGLANVGPDRPPQTTEERSPKIRATQFPETHSSDGRAGLHNESSLFEKPSLPRSDAGGNQSKRGNRTPKALRSRSRSHTITTPSVSRDREEQLLSQYDAIDLPRTADGACTSPEVAATSDEPTQPSQARNSPPFKRASATTLGANDHESMADGSPLTSPTSTPMEYHQKQLKRITRSGLAELQAKDKGPEVITSARALKRVREYQQNQGVNGFSHSKDSKKPERARAPKRLSRPLSFRGIHQFVNDPIESSENEGPVIGNALVSGRVHRKKPEVRDTHTGTSSALGPETVKSVRRCAREHKEAPESFDRDITTADAANHDDAGSNLVVRHNCATTDSQLDLIGYAAAQRLSLQARVEATDRRRIADQRSPKADRERRESEQKALRYFRQASVLNQEGSPLANRGIPLNDGVNKLRHRIELGVKHQARPSQELTPVSELTRSADGVQSGADEEETAEDNDVGQSVITVPPTSRTLPATGEAQSSSISSKMANRSSGTVYSVSPELLPKRRIFGGRGANTAYAQAAPGKLRGMSSKAKTDLKQASLPFTVVNDSNHRLPRISLRMKDRQAAREPSIQQTTAPPESSAEQSVGEQAPQLSHKEAREQDENSRARPPFSNIESEQEQEAGGAEQDRTPNHVAVSITSPYAPLISSDKTELITATKSTSPSQLDATRSERRVKDTTPDRSVRDQCREPPMSSVTYAKVVDGASTRADIGSSTNDEPEVPKAIDSDASSRLSPSLSGEAYSPLRLSDNGPSNRDLSTAIDSDKDSADTSIDVAPASNVSAVAQLDRACPKAKSSITNSSISSGTTAVSGKPPALTTVEANVESVDGPGVGLREHDAESLSSPSPSPQFGPKYLKAATPVPSKRAISSEESFASRSIAPYAADPAPLASGKVEEEKIHGQDLLTHQADKNDAEFKGSGSINHEGTAAQQRTRSASASLSSSEASSHSSLSSHSSDEADEQLQSELAGLHTKTSPNKDSVHERFTKRRSLAERARTLTTCMYTPVASLFTSSSPTRGVGEETDERDERKAWWDVPPSPEEMK